MFGKKSCMPSVFSVLWWIGAAAFAAVGVLCMIGAARKMAPALCRKAKMVEKDCADACRKIADDVCGGMGSDPSCACGCDETGEEGQAD